MKTGVSMSAEHNAMHLNGVLRNMLDDIRKDERDNHEKPPEKARRGHKPTVGTDEQVLICRSLQDLCGWPEIRIAKAVGLSKDEVKYICSFRVRCHLIPKREFIPEYAKELGK